MPRKPGWKRSEATARRWEHKLDLSLRGVDQLAFAGLAVQVPRHEQCPEPTTRLGSGSRHSVKKQNWPTSSYVDKPCKWVVPPVFPDKKFAFVLGNSHLRAIVDGFVPMPEDGFSFGFCSIPGGSARDICKELSSQMACEDPPLQREPDVVCLLAPCNNITASKTVTEAASEFARLLDVVCSRWQEVCVLDFPPRRTVEVELQQALREEYRRVAARREIRYFPVAEHFRMDRLWLWCWDGVHLSDDHGMGVYANLLQQACYQQLEGKVPTVVVPPSPSKPYTWRYKPRVVVAGPEPSPRPPPPEWTVIGQGRERNRPRASTHTQRFPRGPRLVQPVRNTPILPLSPTMFSEANMLKVEKVYPSCLDSTSSTEETPPPRSRKPAARQRRHRRLRVARAAAGEVTHSSLLTEQPGIEKQTPVEVRLRPSFPRFFYSGRRAMGRERAETRERSRSPQPPPLADEMEWPPLIASESPMAVTSQSPVMTTPEILGENVSMAISPAVSRSRRSQRRAETAKLETGRPGSAVCSLALMDVEVAHGGGLAEVIIPTSVTIRDTCLEEDDQDLLDLAQKESSPPLVATGPPTLDCPPVPSPPAIAPRTMDHGLVTNPPLVDRLTIDPSAGPSQPPLRSTSSIPPAVQEEGASAPGIQAKSTTQSLPVPSVVMGSFNQSDSRFEYAGVQCMAIALVALAQHNVSSVLAWKQRDLDRVLTLGDRLYNERRYLAVREGYTMLAFRDLPTETVIEGKRFMFDYSESLNGDINVVSGEHIERGLSVTLDCAFERMFAQYHTCLFTLGEYTVAIIKEGGFYAVVDSHARSSSGLPHPDGKSVVLYFSSLDELYAHFCRFGPYYGERPFEIIGVSFNDNEGLKHTESAEVPSVSPTAVISLEADAGCKEQCVTGETVVLDESQGDLKHIEAAEDVPVIDLETEVNPFPDVESDVLCTGVEHSVMFFNPLSDSQCKGLCGRFAGEFEKHCVVDPKTKGPLGAPCKNDKIAADGNCFFRAVSQAISGTQKYHLKIRRAIAKHLRNNSEKYKSLLRVGFSSVDQYLNTTKIHTANKWATEVEIQVGADYLGVDIFTFRDGHWLKYSCTTRPLSNNGIYLENINNSHFENVICVKIPNKDSCYECCQIIEKSMGSYNIRPKKAALQPLESNRDIETSVRLALSKHLQKKKIKHLKNNYTQNCDVIKGTRKLGYKEKKQEIIEKNLKRYKSNIVYQKKVRKAARDSSKHRYHHDEGFKQEKKEDSRERGKDRYHHDEGFKQEKKGDSRERGKDRYHHDEGFKQEKKGDSRERGKDRYHHDEGFKQEKREDSRNRSEHSYRDEDLKKRKINKVNQRNKHMYRHDEGFKQKHIKEVSQRNTHIYWHNEGFKQKHKEDVNKRGRQNYREREDYREGKKAASRKKSKKNASSKTKLKVKKCNNKKNPLKTRVAFRKKRNQPKTNLQDFAVVEEQFLKDVESGPEYVCCVCFKLLFRRQVLPCRKADFMANPNCVKIANDCISEAYLHACNSECPTPCSLLDCRGSLWICYTCNSKLRKGEMPSECWRNELDLDDIPPELACLNTVEAHLVAPNINFMQVLALPKGGQRGIHGPVTCVPSRVQESVKLLPRSNMDGCLLAVKIKRSLSYKGHYEYQFVDTELIRQAIAFLKQYNPHYSEMDFNTLWDNEFARKVDPTDMEVDLNVEVVAAEQEVEPADLDDEHLHDRQGHCIFHDTVLLPVDIGQEALDHFFKGVVNLAPAEGNSPVSLLSDKENEAKCFPKEFPFGRNTFHTPRLVRLTMCRYFINRLMHVDGRFARNLKFLFMALYMLELEQVVSKVQIALRKGISYPSNAAAGGETLQDMLQYDSGYRFLAPIRGTPAFWQNCQKDLFAMIRQLGLPTWFCSFSSADLRWKSLLKTLLKQEGSTRKPEDLDWAERCDLLRRNPVTAARMFESRWRCFLQKVIMSPAQPIGKVKDYFYRIEFQQRGSPHAHMLVFLDNGPRLGVNTDEEVVQFVDKYISCELPSDPELLEKVTSVQQHSKRHAKTCQKGKIQCRFNFPRPVSMRTFVKQEFDPETPPIVTKEEAKLIMAALKNATLDENNLGLSTAELFDCLGLTQFTFEQIYSVLGGNRRIVLKREVSDIWINNYNKKLLSCWNANMDIQFVENAWACVVYIISYITKKERDMGLLLGNAQKEASKGNVSAKEAFKKLGSVYLHNREVSAQEAVYRVTGMHLKEFSRQVTFIPTGNNIVRMSRPIGEIDDEMGESIWMTNTIERYLSRPNDDTFNDMCIATFVSEYRLLYKSDKCKKPIMLQKGLGAITKRTRTKPAVVRYARFSETKDTELFHQSLLQLFLPYRVDDDLKPLPHESFEQFYKNGEVSLSDGALHLVKSIVDSNRRRFELTAENLEEVQDQLDDDILEDAWGLLCPEQEAERLETREEYREMLEAMGSEHEQDPIPDLAVRNEQIGNIEKSNVMSRQEGLLLIKTLNEQQLSIFYKARQWCLDKLAGNNPEPIHLFVTGGAGTGKSHLIRALQYELSRLLAPICHSPDNVSVLLTAPTGIAAYNLEASTIHTTFSIGTNVSLPYMPLGEEKLNTLRAKYIDVQFVIIDEISMVDQKLFTYIHGRLRQIKQTGDSPFGKVSIIVVGDFFQLSPVKGHALYKESIGVNFFTDLFKIAELKTIVRQKEPAFAKLLNRLRMRSRLTPLLESDINVLKRCETGEDPDVLHIFTKNKFVNEYNIKTLTRVCQDTICIAARDFGYDKKTGKLTELESNLHNSKLANLEETLIVGVNARVMLCKNIDIADGLVNGVCGIVTYIVENPQRRLPPLAIYVKFDNDKVGAQRRRQTRTPADLTGSTRIEPEEEQANKRGEKRRQFPLKLAWACTVHKVQGITVDRAVVSLKQVFTAGQAYVALSRVRSLEGLVIQDFTEKAIYCNDNIRYAIECMPPFMVQSVPWPIEETHVLTFFYMNVHGLASHVSDLVMCTQPWQPNCIAVVETWLNVNSAFQTSHIDGYSFNSRPRSVSYQGSNHPALVSLSAQQHGGVGLYCKDSCNYEITERDFSLECLVSHFAELKITVAVVYRPPSYPMSLFKYNLNRLLIWLDSFSATVAVMGDFNDDILKSSSLCNFMTERGYVQYVKSPTTERGTLIDHLYLKSTEYDLESTVVPTYFSDHEGIVCSFRIKP